MTSLGCGVLGLRSLLNHGPTEASPLTAAHIHAPLRTSPPSFLPLAEIHLQLGSVILVFSTLGISRSCAAILAFLMHWNEQTLKVCIAWWRLGLQLPPEGRVRAGPGRKGALIGGVGREGSGKGAPSPVLYTAYHTEGQVPKGLGQRLRLIP